MRAQGGESEPTIPVTQNNTREKKGSVPALPLTPPVQDLQSSPCTGRLPRSLLGGIPSSHLLSLGRLSRARKGGQGTWTVVVHMEREEGEGSEFFIH